MPNLTGQSIGRYHILEQLGEGGMATVYKAYDTRLERNVAFKILRTDLFGEAVLEQVLKRFEREAKSLAKLSHSNIVNILDYGEHEGMPYLVMEYLPGGTLKQKLGEQFPWREALRILLPVAHGLSYAHQRSVVHRDVKPANILLKEENIPVLTDFGIAKLLEGADGNTLTASGVGMGTPEYMAPEQGIGASTIDSRADIYSFGIVLYEMITGRKPYIADTPMAVILKQMTDPLPRPTDFVPDLPEKVEQILLKALAKEPEDRYADMDTLIDALETTFVQLNQQEIVEGDTHSQEKKLEDTSNPLTEEVKPKQRKQPAQFTKNLIKNFKVLSIVILVAGIGAGGYFAWQRWGVSNIQLVDLDGTIERVCLIYTAKDIRSYKNASIWQGILDATNSINAPAASYQTEASEKEIQGTLDTMYRDNCDLIISNGDWLKDQFLKSAKENPTIFYLPVDVSFTGIPRPLPDNLIEQTYSVYDSAYLAGYLAAGSTQTGKVGTFGAEKTETIMEFMDGFVAGVQRHNADFDTQVEIIGWDPVTHTGLIVGDFKNYEAHTLHAYDLIQDGVDIIFIVSTIEAARGAINRASEIENMDVRIIGVDQDWKSYLTTISTGTDSHPEVILGSVKKYDEQMVTKAIVQLQSGTFDGTPIIGNLGNGGIDLIYYDEDIDSQLKADLEHLWEEVSGVSKDSNLPATTESQTSEPPLPLTAKPEAGNPFLKAILSYISEKPPTFEDDFSEKDMVWGSTSEGHSIFALVENGDLTITDHTEDVDWTPDYAVPGVSFPVNKLFNAANFALEYDFAFEGVDEIGVGFRLSSAQNRGYYVFFSQYEDWHISQDEEIITSGTYFARPSFNKVLIVVSNENLSVYLNDDLIHESNDLIDIGTTNNFLIIGDHGGQGRFDNVRFWNLDGVKISESVTPTPSTSGSEWEVSFANPILTYISDRQPDLEDNFESRSGVWAPADWCADWRMKYESGKLLVDGCYIQYKGAPFTDYVVEVSSSFVSQRGEIGILFRDDLCRMIISQDFGMEASCERFINGELTTTDIIKKEYHPQSSNPFHLRVIAKGGRFAFYLDGEPVGYFEEEAIKFGSQLELTVEVGGTIGTLDDFKIWDISELEIP